MIPTWMIEDLERLRRERERQARREQPELHIEVPEPARAPRPPRAADEAIVIELGRGAIGSLTR